MYFIFWLLKASITRKYKISMHLMLLNPNKILEQSL